MTVNLFNSKVMQIIYLQNYSTHYTEKLSHVYIGYVKYILQI